MKSKKRIHPAVILVAIHIVALGLAAFLAEQVAQAYAGQAVDHSSHMQFFPLNDGTYPVNQLNN